MAEITKEEMRERLGNIDQIRDIIFGSQLRDYNSRFEKIESDLALLQQDTQDRVEQLKTVLTSEIKSSVENLDKKIKTLTSNSLEELTDLRQQADRLNRKFSSSIEALDEALDNQTNSLREELGQTRDQLQDEVRSLKSQVLEELERRFSLLTEVKISRDDMAEVLFEVGMRLKGTEFIPTIQQAADEKHGSFSLPEHHL
jgi:archaellum component FlaC